MFWVLPIGLLRGSILTTLQKAVTEFTMLGFWVGVVVLAVFRSRVSTR
jgi:hypothetical protein